MSKVSKCFPILVLTVVLGASAVRAQTQPPPRIFFTDLTSGPNTGGENNNGTILTIYGKNFGATQGTSKVTVGGGAVAAYLAWGTPAPGLIGIRKISVAIGSAAATGNVVVTVNGQASNGVSFTVRAGNIYCVSTTGSDSNTGKFPNQCWATIPFAVHGSASTGGDIIYVEDGFSVTGGVFDGISGRAVHFTRGGFAQPMALIAYPNAIVTIGDQTSGYNKTLDVAADNWVVAGFILRSSGPSLSYAGNSQERAVGNDISCTGSTGYACTIFGGSAYSYLGNYWHDVGQQCNSNSNTCKLFHTLYGGPQAATDSGYIVAWNTLDPDPNHTLNAGCRAIQIYSGANNAVSDAHVHDNVIRNSTCDGINLANSNPDAGTVEAYNNVIYHAGTNGVSSAPANCIRVLASTGTHTASVEIYNNTMYDCGPDALTGSSGLAGAIALDGFVPVRFRNNVVQQLPGEPYIGSGYTAHCNALSGSNNLWFGAGAPPCSPTFNSDVNADPKYVNPSVFDFHLQSGSPAINAGVNTGIATDLDGVPHPPYSVGAYEFVSSAPKPNPPTNLSLTVQ